MMQDALASNAGDRYHFVYAARRMLDMLHPRNNLELIQMENVAEEDMITPETFLGVDLTEYYGGMDRNSAQKIGNIVIDYFARESFRGAGIRKFVIDIIERLLRQGLPQEAKAFLLTFGSGVVPIALGMLDDKERMDTCDVKSDR
jgi:hypothetical protein